MIASMSPVQIGNPISPGMVLLDASEDLDLADCELTPSEFTRLLGEIDRMQLGCLIAPRPAINFDFEADRAA